MLLFLLAVSVMSQMTSGWLRYQSLSGISNRGVLTINNAKKNQRSKAKQVKKSGMEWARNFELMPYDSSTLRELASLASSTYIKITGKALDTTMQKANDIPKALWNAPFGFLLIDANSTVMLCNLAATEALNQTHSRLIGASMPLPSTMTKHIESKYTKRIENITLNKTTRWKIDRAVILDGALTTESVGIGYAFPEWQLDDRSICQAGGIRRRPLADIKAQLDKQATEVRRLKENEGKTNQDPEVKAAVKLLISLKDEVAAAGGGGV